MNLPRFLFAAWLGLASNFATLAIAADDEIGPEELADVVRGLQRRAELFLAQPNCRVTFAMQDLQVHPPFQYPARVGGGTTTLAHRGGKLYARRVDPESPIYKEPGLVSIYRDDGDISIDIAGNARADICNGRPFLTCQFWNYTDWLHLNVYRLVSGNDGRRDHFPANRPVYLPEDVEEHASAYRMIARYEEVDGTRCAVLERPGVARFALDPERGYAIIRSESWTQLLESQPPVQTSVKWHRALKEVVPGLWLPMKIVEQILTDDPNYRDKPISERCKFSWAMTVSDLSFAELDERIFQPSLPDGAQVRDQIRNVDFQVVGGNNGIVAVMEFVKNRRQVRHWLVAVSLGIVTVVGGFVAWRLYRQRLRMFPPM